MRTLTKDSDIYEIRDKIVKIYLKRILRRFKQLNQRLISFDEINVLSEVNAAYDDVIDITVEALKEVSRRTYKWLNGRDDDFPVDMWLSGYLKEPDPVLHYIFYDEADRKRSRLYEAIESVTTKAGRKEQIDIGLRYWSKQFEQTADNVVGDVTLLVYKNNGVNYVKWMTWRDAKVCAECDRRQGKIYPINSDQLRKLHWNCRCWWIPVGKIG